MASLKNIKIKIQSYKKTGTVTHAMEAVSAVKMRKSQERALGSRAYAAAALSVLERLSGTVEVARHPLMNEALVKVGALQAKTCFVVITSDKGLAGSLNSAVIRKSEDEIVRLGLTPENVVMIALGRRGGDYFINRGYDVRLRLENVSDDVSETQMREVTDKLIEWHQAGEVGAVRVVYTNFISTFEQEAITRTIVPITPALIAEIVAGIRPARGRYSPVETLAKEAAPISYTIEPDADSVLSVLLPRLLNIAMFHTMLESKASEHSARMVAMKSATDKAKDMAKSYTRTFNKIRQAAITREVSEITSGMEAMK
ncbi:MAG TPA: ATP synthase F1 subunit gamma [Candidatus Paceibacterota bacterium]|nr:ATP synthase F1 subunit gamma [Candidatus Paceibacterota bacterium]